MTIKQLYEWAVKNEAEEYDIEIQYCDGGGFYYGTRTLCESDIEINRSNAEVML